MQTLKYGLLAVIATIMLWAGVVVVHHTVTGAGWLQDLTILTAFGSTVAIWLVLALDRSEQTVAREREKAKRTGASGETGDQRLALLLALMDEDQKEALRQRLVDDLSADGEAISLADLLGSPDGARQRRS
jgi:hypothetical protein